MRVARRGLAHLEQQPPRERREGPVGLVREPRLRRLELLDRGTRVRSVDAVDLAGVEPQQRELLLRRLDSVGLLPVPGVGLGLPLAELPLGPFGARARIIPCTE